MRTADVERHFGTRYKAAKALGLRHQAVYKWGTIVPELSARRLQILTRGRLKVDESLYAKTQPA